MSKKVKFAFKHPYSIGIFGIPESGKSHLLKFLMYQTKDLFDLVIVITGTKHNHFFDFINNSFVHEYSDALIDRIIDKTTEWMSQKKKINTLVVFDDILGQSHFSNDLWLKLVNNHRHYNISYIIVTQYIKAIPPNIRSNLHYAFVFGQTNKTSINGIHESFFVSHYDLKETTKMLGKLKRYQTIFVSNKEYEKEKKFRNFTAPEKIPSFKITNEFKQ